MIKHINEIKQDYIGLCHTDQGLWLVVKEIHWPHPHIPVDHWKPVKRLGTHTTPDTADDTAPQAEPSTPEWTVTALEMEKAINQLLNSRRYFGICGHCRQLYPSGHMHGELACCCCAERFLGIIY